MILPIRTDSPLRSTPWMNWLLILANVGAFFAQLMGGSATPGRAGGDAYMLYPRDPHVYQFITYAFLHGGWAHIIGNMLFLYIFGNNVNDKLGNLGYLAFYLAGGVFSGVGYVLTQQGPYPILGASGAVAAVTGAYLVLFPRSSITLIYFFYLIGSFDIPALYFVVFFFVKDLVFSFAPLDAVAHTAHVSGTLFGFVICFALLLVHLLPRDQFDILALIQRWNRRRQYQGMVRQGFDPWGYSSVGRPPREDENDPQAQRLYELRGEISEALAHRDHPKAARLYRQLHAADPQQVLSRQAQLDVANQLASEQAYVEAADAYELFLRAYPNFDQIEQVQLMLGLIYARYLERYDRAQEYLAKATQRLHSDRQMEMAQDELSRIRALPGGAGPIPGTHI